MASRRNGWPSRSGLKTRPEPAERRPAGRRLSAEDVRRALALSRATPPSSSWASPYWRSWRGSLRVRCLPSCGCWSCWSWRGWRDGSDTGWGTIAAATVARDGPRTRGASSRSTDGLDLRPLTARSVILSVLLGAHPPILPVRSIVRTTELFGISEGTTRVALSRLAADQDVVAEDGQYHLSDRLLARQRRLDEGRVPVTRPWRGGWEMAVVAAAVRGAAGRAAVGTELAALRLGELRSGVWARPANLRRPWPDSLRDLVWRFEVRPLGPSFDGSHPESDSPGRRTSGPRTSGRRTSERPSVQPWQPAEASALTAGLWDLKGWAGQAEALLSAFSTDQTPAHRFVMAAAMVRHLQTDPLLPASLLPDQWPGPRLRQAYAGYEREMVEMLRREQRRHA